MPAADLFERELMARELAEDPRARAARLANQRWVTQQRLWSAMDREGVLEPGAQARFICERLWPELRSTVIEEFVAIVRRNTALGEPLRRPRRARDIVGDRLERLMFEHGYEVEGG